MKLLKPFVVPFGYVVTDKGKMYQQGQRVPAGTVLVEVSPEIEPPLKEYLKKERTKKPTEMPSEG